MRSFQQVIILGSVGKDPEIKSTGGGTLVANFSMATSSSYKDKSGEWQEKTEWHNMVAYARTAEIIRDYVQKGAPLHIVGHLQTRNWEDKDSGKKVYRTEIIVDSLSMLGGKRDGESSGNSRKSTGNSGRGPSRNDRDDDRFDRTDGSNFDEDIPF